MPKESVDPHDRGMVADVNSDTQTTFAMRMNGHFGNGWARQLEIRNTECRSLQGGQSAPKLQAA
jgi:hypothetical protein